MAALPSVLDFTRQFPGGSTDIVSLRAVNDVPHQFQSIFAAHPFFNILQSTAFNSIFESNQNVVVSAPTGSGKTCIFEMAIVKMISSNMSCGLNSHACKAIYLAPIKALCDERHADWSSRFGKLGYNVRKFTGDSDGDDLLEMHEADVVIATPEKWDTMTRRWKDNEFLMKTIWLFMVDEVHLIGDSSRGKLFC